MSGGSNRPAARRTRDRGATLARAALVLDAVAQHTSEGGISLTELSRLLGFRKSTTQRLLAGLEQIRFVERCDGGEGYRIGAKLVELAGKFLDDSNLTREAAPILYQAMLQSQETVHLAILDGAEIVYIAKVDAPQSVRLHSHIGDRRPAHTAAVGKAIIAWKPAAVIDSIIAAGLPQRTPKSITDPDMLRASLEEVRNRGYAVDDEETTLGVRCVAAPVLNYRGSVIAAVSISGPTIRVGMERIPELAQVAKDAASKVSQRMGHSPG